MSTLNWEVDMTDLPYDYPAVEDGIFQSLSGAKLLNTNPERSETEWEYEQLTSSAFMFKDGRLLLKIVRHPLFASNVEPFLKMLNESGYSRLSHWRHDSVLLNTVLHLLAPYLTEEHEVHVRNLLSSAIQGAFSLDVLNKLDQIWSRICSELDTFIYFPELYNSEASEESGRKDELVKKVIMTGIYRHVRALLRSHPYKDSIITNPQYLKKILKCTFKANLSNSEILYLLPNTKEAEINEMRQWYCDKDFLSTEICAPNTPPLSDEDVIETVIPKILCQMCALSTDSESQEIMDVITALFLRVSNEIAKLNKDFYFMPILVGSSSEAARCFTPDEYDFLLHLKCTKWLKKYYMRSGFKRDLIAAIQTVLLKSEVLCTDERLLIESCQLFVESVTYPCLKVAWFGEKYKDITISIDLVPCASMTKSVSLRHHSYLPAQFKCKGIFKRLMKCMLIPLPAFEEGEPQIYRTFDHRVIIVYSQIENELVKALPEYIRSGYKIAKAMRITRVIEPILQQLIELNAGGSSEVIVKTYYLKTCLFFSTMKHSGDENRDPWYWAIKIYEKLKEFLIKGEIPQYFEEELKFSCYHSCEEALKENKYRCCRERSSKLLIVERILWVLDLCRDRYPDAALLFGQRHGDHGLDLMKKLTSGLSGRRQANESF